MLDVAKRQFTTKSGAVFTLRPVSALILERVYNSTRGKPQVPVVEVVLGDPQNGGVVRKEANPNDPQYLEDLQTWRIGHGQDVMRYQIGEGVLESPPEEFIEHYREYFPDATKMEMKYLWVVSLMEADEIQELSEAILSQTTLTIEGVKLAEEIFRSPGERE